MNSKWIGALLILLSCGSCGFSIASEYKKEERMYRNLIWILAYMRAELQFHMTSLPDLCGQAGNEAAGDIRMIFRKLSEKLESYSCTDAASCMQIVLNEEKNIPAAVRKTLLDLGRILGRFDLDGQLRGLDVIKMECEKALEILYNHRDERLRGYRTLGMCAGAALVILFI